MSIFNKIIEKKFIKKQHGLTNDQFSNLKKATSLGNYLNYSTFLFYQ